MRHLGKTLLQLHLFGHLKSVEVSAVAKVIYKLAAIKSWDLQNVNTILTLWQMGSGRSSHTEPGSEPGGSFTPHLWEKDRALNTEKLCSHYGHLKTSTSIIHSHRFWQASFCSSVFNTITDKTLTRQWWENNVKVGSAFHTGVGTGLEQSWHVKILTCRAVNIHGQLSSPSDCRGQCTDPGV